MTAPLPYLQRIRDYYRALGYETPYRWASFDNVPFQPLKKSLNRSTIGIVTTAAPYQPDKGDQGPGAAYNGSAKFYDVYTQPTNVKPDLRISHIAIDRTHTTAEDMGTYFPLLALQKLQASGIINQISPRFYGLPTNRSHRTTIDIDCVELTQKCVEDGVDAAVLVPNCPVCHQSVSLAARALEQAGISTVIMGCAKDIVEHVGVPRLLFSDFPLGNAAGLPNHGESQLETARLALDLLVSATEPRTTNQSLQTWSGASDWKKDYSNAALLSEAELARRREEFDQGKQDAKRAAQR